MSVNSVKRIADQEGNIQSEEIELIAVYGDTDENKQWSKWTPQGRLNFTVNNPPAMGQVLPGQMVYVDITQVPKA